MKSNTQNAKIEAVTENTLVVGIDVGSEGLLTGGGSSSPESHLSSAIQNRASQSLRHGSFTYRQSMIRMQ